MQVNYIYIATNKVQNKVYVGSTTNSMEKRIEDHIVKANNHNGSVFQEAIGTYGPDAFNWEVIDIATTTDELAEKETGYILKYDSFKSGYNSDRGGGFKKTVYQYNIETGELMNFYDSLSSAANAVNAASKSISNACLGYNKTCKGYHWSYSSTKELHSCSDLRRKTVNQISLDGDIVACYESASEASRKTGISKTCITRCCRGERGQSGGFFWKYS